MNGKPDMQEGRSTGLATPSPRRILLLTAILIVAGSGIAIFHQFDPARHGFFPRCWLHSATGLHCPGCGGQRAVHALLNGDLAGAARNNLMLVLALGIGAWLGIVEIHRRWRSLPPRLPRPGAPKLVWVFLAAFLLFGILRNIPVPPFTHLAP